MAWIILVIVGIIYSVSANTQTDLKEQLGRVPILGDTTPGSIWPHPQSLTTTTQVFNIDVEKFTFLYNTGTYECRILDEAFKRYTTLIKQSTTPMKLKFQPKGSSAITALYVNLGSACEQYPSLNMDEAYTLDVGSSNVLNADSVWGILRGLESFSQLLWEGETGEIVVNKTNIIDYPRYSHRGILLDTARHFLPVSIILKNLDAMAYNKYNVLHWHIVDDQSFPFVSQVYPNLSAKGAFTPLTRIYKPEHVAEVIEYARLRGIRVVPEFDTPGHSQSWGKSQPDLLTTCYEGEKPSGTFGPINPIVDTSYTFIQNLFAELRNVFPEKYIHLGGDEVNFACWKTNPKVTKYMKDNNITGNYAKLEEIYMQKLINICERIGFSYIVWQEVIDNGVQVKEDTIVEVWKNHVPQAELAKVTKMGYRAIITAPWYLNAIALGEDWKKFYQYDPSNFNGTAEQKALVIGGEACMWGEFVDATNILSRLWPRASAVAERLWSSREVKNLVSATLRLHQHRCRMMLRGIPAEPLHPGYCRHAWIGEH